MFTLKSAAVIEVPTRELVIAKADEVQNLGITTSDHAIAGMTLDERALHAALEKELHDKFLGGLMKHMDWSIAEVFVNGVWIRRRVNGQHSSLVFLNLTDAEWTLVRFPVVIVETVYTCDTLLDMAVLYEQFDPRKSARTREDLMTVHLANEPDLRGQINSYASTRAVQGIAWYQIKVEGYRRPAISSDLGIVHENDEIHAFLKFCGEGGLRLNRKMSEMASKPVLAAMYHTTRQGGEDDQGFWKRVSGGPQSFSDEDSYGYKLAAFLDQARNKQYEWPRRTREQFYNKKCPDDIEVFATCLRVFAGHKHDTRISEAFMPVKERHAAEIVKRLYPLPSAE
jgi:hypothetical protein